MIKSSYISIDDDKLMNYEITQGKLIKRKHHWDFAKLGWWSRIYEYKFLQDCINSLQKNISVLDVATGPFHPGSFILENNGINNVDAVDIINKPKIFNRFSRYKISYFIDDMSNTQIEKQYDLVVCISTLEHVPMENQKSFLENMIKLTKVDGHLILTFDDPGFEQMTNIEMYKSVLLDNNCQFEEEEISQDKILTNYNGPIKRNFFEEGVFNSEQPIKVYKMFIKKNG